MSDDSANRYGEFSSSTRPQASRRWLITLGLPLATVALFAWVLFGFHIDEPSGFVTATQAAAYTGLPLPPEAKNIRMAGYRQWIEEAQYVRFEAPVDVCLAYAAKVVASPDPLPAADDHLRVSAAKPLRPKAFRDFSWFDLDKATNVVSGGGNTGLFTTVWVDRDRGVFYCRRSD